MSRLKPVTGKASAAWKAAPRQDTWYATNYTTAHRRTAHVRTTHVRTTYHLTHTHSEPAISRTAEQQIERGVVPHWIVAREIVGIVVLPSRGAW